MYRDRGRLAAKVPEQPLLSNPLSDPAERGIRELSKPAPIVRRCLVAMSFFYAFFVWQSVRTLL